MRPAPSPAIDLDSPEVQAFSLRGRVAASPPIEGELREGIGARASVTGSPAPTFEAEPSLREEPVVDDPWRHVAVKIPAVSGQKLSEIADLRCSKRTRVALELLQGPLRELARAHRAGEYPPLRRVTSGVLAFWGVSYPAARPGRRSALYCRCEGCCEGANPRPVAGAGNRCAVPERSSSQTIVKVFLCISDQNDRQSPRKVHSERAIEDFRQIHSPLFNQGIKFAVGYD